tara:strand:- start:1357 stop:2091 length:735 start_codon:yes stop_codon:yes gene_type:complete
MKHKKSMTVNALIIIIIALAAAIVLIIAASRFALLTKESADVNTCRFSVMLNSEVKEKTFNILEDTSIQCDAIEYNVEPKHTEQDNVISIAQQLDDCWYKMGAGEFNVFGKDFILSQGHCIVCSEFTVNNDIKVSDLENTLKTRKSKWEKKLMLDKYFLFKKNFKFTDFGENGEQETSLIKKNNPYLVVFRRYGESQTKTGAKKLLLAPETEDQRMFITHENGLSKISHSSYKCDQLLWEKKIK